MKTFSARAENIQRQWYIIDAQDYILGRLATEVARRLRGKHKPEYTPHVDTGDYIIIINADKIKVTGRKYDDKMYYRHSGYPGGLRTNSFKDLLERHPERIIKLAVKGMLPKNTLGRQMLKKLKVYAGVEHKHHAQQPQELQLNEK
jgi:large subunit ribosomal protein L13